MPDILDVVHLDDLETYSPPLHDDTVNRRLVPAELGVGFEMVHGTLAPGGGAHRHKHTAEWQVIYLLEGEAVLDIGDAPRQSIRAGSIIRIPPDTPHYFEVVGDAPARVIVIYSPPLGKDGFVAA